MFVIDTVLRYRLIVLFLLFLIISYGLYSYKTLPIDTFPDPTPIQVNIYTEAPGLSSEEVETLITKKIETFMGGIKDVTTVRSVSLPGLSYISVFFKDGTDVYFARRLVMEKLADVKGSIPAGYNPVMGPNSSGLGNVLIYALTSYKRSLTDLKTIQEWKIKPLIKSVEGIEDIVQWGPERAFVVRPNPDKLMYYNIDYTEVVNAIKNFSAVTGGGYSKTPEGDLVVRAVGHYTDINSILDTPIKETDGFIVKIRDVATVEDGELPNRRGAFTLNGQEVQGNIVLKRVNTNTKEVVKNLKEKIENIKKILPEDVKLNLLYDQSYLTEKAIHTIQKALIEGIVLVAIAMFIYLGNIRTAFVVILSIPLTLLMAFIFMKESGLSGNLMSLAGLAIGIGLFADATVVVIENIYRNFSHYSMENKVSIIEQSVKEVFKPVFFAILIIVIVFLPIFSFESVEGKYFKPLALTIIFALLSSLFVAFIFMPVLSYFILKPDKEEETKLIKIVNTFYHKILNRALTHGKLVIISVISLFLFSLFLLSKIGTEFAPTLDEGGILVKSFLDPNVNLNQAKEVAFFVEEQAKKFDEVEYAFSNIGRSEKGEPEDVYYIETFIILKPYNEWKNIKTRQELEGKIREKITILPGVSFSFTQPIQMRIDELLSGVKSTVAVKIFGDDLYKINEIAYKVENLIRNTPGAVDVETEAQSGKLQLKIVPKKEILSRYNLTVEDLFSIIKNYFASEEINVVKDGLITFPIVVRLPEDVINNVDMIKNLTFKTKDGYILTLWQVADISISEGFAKIRHENGQRFALVQSNLQGRDLGSFVNDIKQKIDSQIKLPQGYYIEFGGQFENQQRAMKKLSIIVPIVILLIFILLFINYNSIKDALIVILNVPFATIGGILSLYISGFNLSVPASIGFIAVFGIATLNGVVLISYIRQLLESGLNIDEAIQKATKLRLRPILITATASSLGLIPILLTTDIGSEVQKPIAVVVVGGIFTSTLLTLIVLPIVYRLFNKNVESSKRLS
ncbi:MAG: CusA/CzcA family heavy metal efflux RND transporter [Hydrogenothermaceae bacterium]|nr:CusA/CzcA family heavy metal efflux RND transporter [Hydrogenothermaceae bacterium]